MSLYRKHRIKDASVRKLLLVILLTVLCVCISIYLLRNYSLSEIRITHSVIIRDTLCDNEGVKVCSKENWLTEKLNLPKQNELSIMLAKRNELPPKNMDLHPKLAEDRIVIVLYVHNRPQYLKMVVDSLSKVEGISETLLIVSHDGFFEEMNEIIDKIRFCQVKQIFAPYSPHLFKDSFPGVSYNDCKEKEDPMKNNCQGTPDQYRNHRLPRIVSLKHHWWWMMNTIWDGLKETRKHLNHILFIEEDHYIFPNAYKNLQLLIKLKREKCPDCYAVNLAPSDVKSRGEGLGLASLIAERMGNVGYAFNRTVWRKIHNKGKEFCWFDEYNWDITMWATVYPSFGSPVYTLRGPRTSAIHFGKCGLHQGQDEKLACIDNGGINIEIEDTDKKVNIKSEWDVIKYKHQTGYKAGFRGWGGWGDIRDRQMCLDFAKMYGS